MTSAANIDHSARTNANKARSIGSGLRASHDAPADVFNAVADLSECVHNLALGLSELAAEVQRLKNAG